MDLLIIKSKALDSLLAECSKLFMTNAREDILNNTIKEYIPKVTQLECKVKDEALISKVLFFYVKTAYFNNSKYPSIREDVGNMIYEITCGPSSNEMHYFVNVTKKTKK